MSNIVQRSFSGGVLAPSLWSRVDQTKYATGLRKCRNFMVQKHGGVANRPGTGFVGEVKNSALAVRLIPFVFNNDQTYVLEFGNLYMRVYRNGAQVTETAKNITGATQANPCVITSAAHGFSDTQEVYVSGVGGMTELNGRNFKIANVTTNTFTLQYMGGFTGDVNSTAFGAYTSGGTAARIYEITTSYLSTDLSGLRFVQSADVVTIVHPLHPPKDLSRTGHAAWAISSVTFGPSISAPTGVGASGTAGTTGPYGYVVTAVKDGTYEESYQSSMYSLNSVTAPSTSQPHTVTWTAVSGATQYNIYRESNGTIGYIGTAWTTSFSNIGYTPDIENGPPEDQGFFNGSGKYPTAITYYQQRMVFGNSNNEPETVWASMSALRKNFTIDWPLTDDGSVNFQLVGRQVNSVQHLMEVGGKLVVFTDSAETTLNGDAAGILTPGNVNPKQHSANGSGILAPILVNDSAIYLQARGSVVRDLRNDYQVDGYTGNDLSVFAAHLFGKYTIIDWAYQQVPHSIVWCARSDGNLLGLTYIRDHQISGWHVHAFAGTVENTCVVPEGTEDVLYLVVKRAINGRFVKYIERMKTRLVDDIKDSVFMDCALSYDGRNLTPSHGMTLSGGTNWTYDETITLTSGISYFASSDVGNAIVLTGSDGTEIRFTIAGYTSGTVVTGKPHKTVPTSMRNVAMIIWAKAVDEVSGLWHLEGQNVSILADGFVSASPNNAAYAVKTVSGGKVTLDDPHAVIHVGIPYTSDMETLDIDTPGPSSLADKKKLINRLTVMVEYSRGLWAGPNEDNLTEIKPEGVSYDEAIPLVTGTVNINITPEWNSNGRVFIQQIDPLPLTVLAVVPIGHIGA